MNYEPCKKEENESMSVDGEGNTSDTYLPTRTPSSGELENLEATGYATSSSSWDLGDYIYRFSSNCDILRETDFGKPTKENAKTIQYVQSLVAALQNVLLNNRINIKPSSVLPPLKFRWLEDNSALIEWIFKDFRIGFSIEPEIEESGWYLVSNDNLQEVSASGTLQFENLEPLIIELLNFALANS